MGYYRLQNWIQNLFELGMRDERVTSHENRQGKLRSSRRKTIKVMHYKIFEWGTELEVMCRKIDNEHGNVGGC